MSDFAGKVPGGDVDSVKGETVHMAAALDAPLDLPRLPVLGWHNFIGARHGDWPSVVDAPHCRYVRSGRVAILLALRALGIGRGDRVLVPTYHCPTMIAPVVATGAEPVFFPIDAHGAPILAALSVQDMKNTRAILAAHYFGLPRGFAPVRAFCDSHGIAFIEDCAHALFGSAEGRPVGAWGDYAIASLTKFLPVNEGGCLTSSLRAVDERPSPPRPLLDQIKVAANAFEQGAAHGNFRVIGPLIAAMFRAWHFRHPSQASAPVASSGINFGGNAALRWLDDLHRIPADGFAATLFCRWMAVHADRERIARVRRRNYSRLLQLLVSVPGARPLHAALPPRAAPYTFPLFVEEPERHYQLVRSAGVPIFRWDEIWPSTPRVAGDSGHVWSSHVFQIGCHQDLSLEAIDMIAAAVRRVLERPGTRLHA